MEGAKDLEPRTSLQIPVLSLISWATTGKLTSLSSNKMDETDADRDSTELWQRPKEGLTKEVTCRAEAWLAGEAEQHLLNECVPQCLNLPNAVQKDLSRCQKK